MDWTTACPSWERKIVAGESLMPCAPLFPSEAKAAMEVFRGLRLVDVPGSPTIGESCRPWLLEFAEVFFGSYDAESGRRLIREFALLVSKKNAKSTIAAAIMLTALIRNWRRSAEYLILAPTIEVANNAFAPARDMVLADPELRDLLHIQENHRKITHRNTRAVLKVVAANSETVSGKKATGVLVDELWEFGDRQNAEAMFMEATGGLASRPEGFTIWLSTQSVHQPSGYFKQKLDRWRAIRDGEVDDRRCLPVLYEFPHAMIERGDHLRRENWHLTNPNYGLSVGADFLDDEFARAKYAGMQSLATFAAKYLNIEIGIGLRTDRWRGAEFWERQADPALAALPRPDRLDALLDRCEVVCVGADGGGLDDIFGLNVLGREREEVEVLVRRPDGSASPQKVKRWLSWSHGWCHRSVMEVRKSIGSRLQDFERAGELTIVDDALDDINDIVDIIVSIRDAGVLGKVAVDPAGLGELADRLLALDITTENGLLMGVGQGYRLMNAIKTAERQLARGMLRHCGSSAMSWCVGNVKIEPLATAIRATKANAGDAKIDLWSAAMNAVEAMGTNPEPFGSVDVFAMVA